MLITGLSGSNGLEVGLSRAVNKELLPIEMKLFPDGESYIRFVKDVRGEDLIIIQSLYPNQDKKFFELLLAVDTAKDLGCRRVITIIPYLAYARQDRRFLDGEAISIKTLLKTLSFIGVDYLITIDIHKEESLKFFNGNSMNLDPTKLYVSKLYGVVRNPVVVAPDQGALDKAVKLSKLLLNSTYVVFRKFRDRVTGSIRHEVVDVDVSGRDVIIVDDIISTGGTVANIASYLREKGASNVYVVCSHGLFVGEALSKIYSSGVSRIYSLNTVPLPVGVESIDITPLLTEAILSLNLT